MFKNKMKKAALVLFLTLTASNIKAVEKDELSKCLQLFRDYKRLTNIAFLLATYNAPLALKYLPTSKYPFFDELRKELADNPEKPGEYMENHINPKWLPFFRQIGLELRATLVDSLTNLAESYSKTIDSVRAAGGPFTAIMEELQSDGHRESRNLVNQHLDIPPLSLSAEQEIMLGLALCRGES